MMRLAVVAVVGLVLLYGCGDDAAHISRSEAVVICQNAVTAAAKYGSDTSALSATIFDRTDRWVIKLPGQMQNGFGAWRNIVAHCEVAKANPDPSDEFSPRALLAFEVIQP